MKKKLLALTLAALMALSLAACGGDTASTDTEAAEDEAAETTEASGQVYNIGICQLAPHPALDAATEGFIDAVTEALGAENVNIDNQNAAGDSNLLSEKAAAAKAKFNVAMDDDLNTPDALAALFELVKDINTLGAAASREALEAAATTFDELTGVLGLLYNRKTSEIPADVMALVEQRAAAKKAKDWATADALRAQITQMGFVVEDTPQGPKVSRA